MLATAPLFFLVTLFSCHDKDGGFGGVAPTPSDTEGFEQGTDIFPGAPDRILVLIIDTLRRDAQGYMGSPCGATPNLDALAEQGVVLESVIPPRGMTYVVLSSLLTGLQPRDHGVWEQDQLDGSFDVWPEAAELQQREVAIFASNGCPVYASVTAPDAYQCLSGGIPGVDEGPLYDEQGVDAMKAWLSEVGNVPTVGILHLLSPHSPYDAQDPYLQEITQRCPDYTEWAVPDDFLLMLEGGITEGEQAWFQRVYESAVARDDAWVGEIVAQLDASGFFDDGILFVGADHGEELFSHPDYRYEEHGYAPWHTVTATSWIAYGPNFLAPARRSEVVCTVDLGATLFEILGEPRDLPDAEGLWEELVSGEPFPARSCMGEVSEDIATWTDDRWHLIANPAGLDFTHNGMGFSMYLDLPEWSLFDHDADPGELDDQIQSEPEVAGELWAKLCADALSRPYDGADQDGQNAILDACQGGVSPGVFFAASDNKL